METQTALIRANGAIKLDTIANVHLYLTLIVYPGHAEDDLALRLYQTLQYSCSLILGVSLDDGLQGFQDLVDRLKELRFARVALLYLRVYLFRVIVFKHDLSPLNI